MPLDFTTPVVEDKTRAKAQVLNLTIEMPIGMPMRVRGVVGIYNAAGEVVDHVEFDEFGADVDAAIAPVYAGVKAALYGLLIDKEVVPVGAVS